MYDKLKVELIYFRSKNSESLEVFKPANFMFVKTDDLHNYVMPVPMNMKLTAQGKKNTWLEIVGIHVYESSQGFGIPVGKSPACQYFGDI